LSTTKTLQHTKQREYEIKPRKVKLSLSLSIVTKEKGFFLLFLSSLPLCGSGHNVAAENQTGMGAEKDGIMTGDSG